VNTTAGRAYCYISVVCQRQQYVLHFASAAGLETADCTSN